MVVESRLVIAQPILFLTVGLPCTGKTTAARRIEVEHRALRLTKDEWVKALFGHENPPSAQDVIEGRLIEVGLRALELGNNVVIDYGLWGRDERSALRKAAADRAAMVHMRYFEPRQPSSGDESISAKPRRHTQHGPGPRRTRPVGCQHHIPTPGELDGSEHLDHPPAGFATSDDWRAYRWPPSVS